MPRALRAAALVGLAFPAALAAQRPSVSPVLPSAWQRDTTLSVWLFVRLTASLDEAVRRATAAGARVRVVSRWLHAVSADAPTAALRALARDGTFLRIQPLGRFRAPPVPSPESRAPSQVDTTASSTSGRSRTEGSTRRACAS